MFVGCFERQRPIYLVIFARRKKYEPMTIIVPSKACNDKHWALQYYAKSRHAFISFYVHVLDEWRPGGESEGSSFKVHRMTTHGF